MEIKNFFQELKTELESLLTSRQPEKQYFNVGEQKYTSVDSLLEAIKLNCTDIFRRNEKLYSKIGDSINIFLKKVSDNDFVGSEPPFFNIVIPGCYVIECEKNDDSPLNELKKVWALLGVREQQAFLAGLEAAKISAMKDNDYPPFFY